MLVPGVVLQQEGRKPIAGAVLEAWDVRVSASQREPRAHAVSNEHGTFQLELPLDEQVPQFRVVATASWCEVAFTSVYINHHSATTEPAKLTFCLAPGGTIEGRVLDSGGSPTLARVRARFPFDSSYDCDLRALKPVTTNQNGEFTLAVRLGMPVLAEASADGFADARSDIVTLPKTEVNPTAQVAITLSSAASVRGTVVFADGRPVASASVWASSLPGSAQRHRRGATADLEGTFLLDGMAAGRYELCAAPPEGRAMRHSQVLDLAPGARVDGLVVEIPSGLPIAGSVTVEQLATNSDDRVRGVTASNVMLVIGHSLEQFTARVDDAGKFRFTCVPPGMHDIELRDSERQRFALVASVLARAGDEHVEIILRPASARLSGIVQSSNGELVPSFDLWLECENRVVDATSYGTEDGRFETQLVPPGRYRLRISARGFRSQESVIDLGPCDHVRDWTVALQPRPSVRGTVRDLGGSPLAGVLVRCVIRRDLSQVTEAPWHGLIDDCGDSAVTDTSGQFRMDVPGEAGELVFTHESFARLRVPLGEQPLDVRLSRGHTVRGRLVSPLGRGVPGLRLSLHLPEESPAINGKPSAISSADGSFAIPRVLPGKWRLAVIGEFNWIAASVEVEVGETDCCAPDIVLRE